MAFSGFFVFRFAQKKDVVEETAVIQRPNLVFCVLLFLSLF